LKLKDIVDSISLSVITGKGYLNREITGGYASDLLSDVLANAKPGNIWITLQTHQNIVAVALMKELSAIILVNNRKPGDDTLKKADEESVVILTSPLSSFELIGRLYQLGIRP